MMMDRLNAVCSRVRAFDCTDTPDDCLDAALADVSAVARDVWAVPARSFEDVLARARIAHALADKERDGSLSHGSSEQERACAELIAAVLALAGTRATFS